MSRPAVVFGGPSPEHDISILTGLQAARALADGGTDPLALYWSKTGDWHQVDPRLEAADFAEGVPRKAKPVSLVAEPGGGVIAKKKPLPISAVLNCCHGGPGEDGTLQAAFDLAGLRYTGPGVAGAALGMDKLAFGAVMAAAGLPTLPRTLLLPAGGRPPPFVGPYIVKPRYGGSSIGIEVVEDFGTAAAVVSSSPYMSDGAVVEPFLAEGRDVNVAVRTFPELQLSALEAPVRASDSAHIYDYSQKYLAGGGLEGSKREIPADLPGPLEKGLRETAEKVARLAGVRSVARIDFLAKDDQFWVNEINTIPGSLAAYLWVDPPIDRFQLLADLLAEAESSDPRRFVVTGADGTALRSAASIAAKLG